MSKVFLGIGHGGNDSGAVANGFKEKDLNLAIGLACRDELARHGVTVKMSREKDEADPLMDEIKECNSFNPDLALDLHNNAGGGDGAEVYHHYAGGKSKDLAQNVLNAICSETGQNSRGLKIRKNIWGKDYFGFIREIKAPSVIVECAFVDNATDIQILNTSDKQKKMGAAIAHGILKTLGIAVKTDESTTVKPTPAPIPTKPTTPTQPTKPVIKKVSISYQVWDDVRNAWLPNVVDTKDYAGILKHDVCAVYANLTSGNVWYRVHQKGKGWLPEVKNRSDYAGVFNKPIDGLMMKTDTGKKIYYRVHLRRKNKWLPWVTGYKTNDGNNGYAGFLGQEIDAIQAYLK